jgi:hypothetical protein
MNRTLFFVMTALALLISGSVRADDAHSALAALVNTADDLYSRLEAMVNSVPRTDWDEIRMVRAVGNQWGIDERNFQDAISRMVRDHDVLSDENISEGVDRLDDFDKFAFATRSAVYRCNAVEARWNLDVAKQELDHAKMALSGHPVESWDPNLDSAPPFADECQE